MEMTKRPAALVAGIWMGLATLVYSQVVNPFAAAESAPQSVSPTPLPDGTIPGATGSTSVVNPFSGAPPSSPESATPGAVNPFSGSAPETSPLPAAVPTPQVAPLASGQPAASIPSDANDEARARALGLTPVELKREIEKSKDRITDLYARGEYDKALKECDYLEKLSPGHPKAVLVRQRIHDRILQGKPIGQPLKAEFDRPVPTAAPPEGEIGPTVESGETAMGPIPEATPAPLEPPAPPVPAASSSPFNLVIVIVIVASVVLLAAVVFIFILMRRSRQRIHEAMTAAQTSPTGAKAVGSPSFPQVKPQAETPVTPPPFSVAPLEEEEELPEPEPPKQQGHLYDLPTMVISEDLEEPEDQEKQEVASRQEFKGYSESGAGSQEPPQIEEVPSEYSFDLESSGEPPETHSPEAHETGGVTFHPFGDSKKTIGEVVSGTPAPAPPSPSASSASSTRSPEMALFDEGPGPVKEQPEPLPPPPPAADSMSPAPPPKAAQEKAPSERPPEPAAADSGDSGEGTPFQMPDILSTDGDLLAIGEHEDGLEKAASNFLSSSADLSPQSGSQTGSGQSGTGSLGIDDFLFSESGGETDMQTVDASASSRSGASSPEGSAGTEEDLTQMSFGQEFDRLMFTQSDIDRTASSVDQTVGSGGETVGIPGGAAGQADTVLDSLLGGVGSTPSSSGTEDETAMITPPSVPPAPKEENEDTLLLAPGGGTPPSAPPPPANLDPFSQEETVHAGSTPDSKVSPVPTPDPRAVSQSEEKLFQREREKGLEAFEAGDWKQAVHYLSVAASLHPDDKELTTKLHDARKQRRAGGEGS